MSIKKENSDLRFSSLLTAISLSSLYDSKVTHSSFSTKSMKRKQRSSLTNPSVSSIKTYRKSLVNERDLLNQELAIDSRHSMRIKDKLIKPKIMKKSIYNVQGGGFRGLVRKTKRIKGLISNNYREKELQVNEALNNMEERGFSFTLKSFSGLKAKTSRDVKIRVKRMF